MISRFLKSKWWNLTAALTSMATVGYVIYIAKAFHIFFVWFFMASLFMTVYEFHKFFTFEEKHDVT
ncbi:MAG: hypothetical protein E7386_03325 [Ruminococcaceae bacterium]|nr:hypothetical protein [Oscillospiraceae bacterium]